MSTKADEFRLFYHRDAGGLPATHAGDTPGSKWLLKGKGMQLSECTPLIGGGAVTRFTTTGVADDGTNIVHVGRVLEGGFWQLRGVVITEAGGLLSKSIEINFDSINDPATHLFPGTVAYDDVSGKFVCTYQRNSPFARKMLIIDPTGWAVTSQDVDLAGLPGGTNFQANFFSGIVKKSGVNYYVVQSTLGAQPAEGHLSISLADLGNPLPGTVTTTANKTGNKRATSHAGTSDGRTLLSWVRNQNEAISTFHYFSPGDANDSTFTVDWQTLFSANRVGLSYTAYIPGEDAWVMATQLSNGLVGVVAVNAAAGSEGAVLATSTVLGMANREIIPTTGTSFVILGYSRSVKFTLSGGSLALDWTLVHSNTARPANAWNSGYIGSGYVYCSSDSINRQFYSIEQTTSAVTQGSPDCKESGGTIVATDLKLDAAFPAMYIPGEDEDLDVVSTTVLLSNLIGGDRDGLLPRKNFMINIDNQINGAGKREGKYIVANSVDTDGMVAGCVLSNSGTVLTFEDSGSD